MGKIAIVTGGSRGIGKAIAEELASKGYGLILLANDKARLGKTAKDIAQKYKVNVDCFACNLSKIKEIDSFEKYCTAKKVAIDVIVNNAGTFISGTTEDAAIDSYEEMQAVNMRGTFYLTQKLIPLIKKGQQKRIIIISTCRALEPYPGGEDGTLYAISKWALRGWARSLREELRKYKIGVTVIYPGAVFTDLWEGTKTPKGQFIDPKDVAKAVCAALSVSPQTVIEDMVIMPLVGNITE